MKILLGTKEVGDDCEPYLVAEVGSNWKSLDDCRVSIRAAKNSGADAVKFQLFDADALYGVPVPELPKGMLPPEWLPRLKQEADTVGIEFLCSAFSPSLIETVNPYVVAHKVASAELTHVRMLEKLKQIGKPVILSTGASGIQDIQMALEILKGIPLILLYCVAEYPARDINLENIRALRNHFGSLVGFSDHSLDVSELGCAAVQKGACLIEKHFTHERHPSYPDVDHSLTPPEFRHLALALKSGGRGRAASLGYTPGERDMLLRHNRRLIATRPLSPGDTLLEGQNFGIYRSLKEDTKALHPFAADLVNGKRCLSHLSPGDGIGPQDFEK